jgi:hypothetical protein
VYRWKRRVGLFLVAIRVAFAPLHRRARPNPVEWNERMGLNVVPGRASTFSSAGVQRDENVSRWAPRVATESTVDCALACDGA